MIETPISEATLATRGNAQAPKVGTQIAQEAVRPRYALLINPFYPKDPHASFGKHVLTPTLALDQLRGDDAGGLGGSRTGTRTCSTGRRPSTRCPRSSGSPST